MMGSRPLRVSDGRCEWQADDSTSCGEPSLTMLGAPSLRWDGPLGPNIV
jgi:hypothetical protein